MTGCGSSDLMGERSDRLETEMPIVRNVCGISGEKGHGKLGVYFPMRNA